jgi:hypothetical protein
MAEEYRVLRGNRGQWGDGGIISAPERSGRELYQPASTSPPFYLALNVISFVDPAVGAVILAAASLRNDSVNSIGDLLDDGKPNPSFKS